MASTPWASRERDCSAARSWLWCPPMCVWRRLVAGILASALVACQQGDTSPKGRGTAACNDWQTAFCDYSKRCTPSTADDDCIAARAVTCSSDSVATGCVSPLSSATCGTIPTGCGEADVADRAVATQLCNDWITGLCSAAVRCGGAGDACVLQLQSQVDCKAVIGVKLQLQDCLDTLQTLSCGADRPESCNEVVLPSP